MASSYNLRGKANSIYSDAFISRGIEAWFSSYEKVYREIICTKPFFNIFLPTIKHFLVILSLFSTMFFGPGSLTVSQVFYFTDLIEFPKGLPQV